MTRSCRLGTLMLVVAGSLGTSHAQQAQKPPITWSVPPGAVRAAAGDVARLKVSARIDDGWHLYSLTQAPPPDPTVLAVPAGQGFTLAGTIEAPVHKGFDEAQGAETEVLQGRGHVPDSGDVREGVEARRVHGSRHRPVAGLQRQPVPAPQTTTLDVPVQMTAR